MLPGISSGVTSRLVPVTSRLESPFFWKPMRVEAVGGRPRLVAAGGREGFENLEGGPAGIVRGRIDDGVVDLHPGSLPPQPRGRRRASTAPARGSAGRSMTAQPFLEWSANCHANRRSGRGRSYAGLPRKRSQGPVGLFGLDPDTGGRGDRRPSARRRRGVPGSWRPASGGRRSQRAEALPPSLILNGRILRPTIAPAHRSSGARDGGGRRTRDLREVSGHQNLPGRR